MGVQARRSRSGGSRPSGQHLLRSKVIIEEIVAQAGVAPDDLVLEIGAGTGGITDAVARAAGRVVAVELDPEFADTLRHRFRTRPTVEIVESDFLEVPLPDAPFRVVGNLPFALTTPILRRVFDDPGSPLVRADLIVQFEVARKRASIWPSNLLALGWLPWWQFELVRHLPAAAFDPRPSVDAGLLSISRRTPALLRPSERSEYVKLLRTAFRREGLPIDRSLRGRISERSWKHLARARGVQLGARASQLDVFDWVAVFSVVRGLP